MSHTDRTNSKSNFPSCYGISLSDVPDCIPSSLPPKAYSSSFIKGLEKLPTLKRLDLHNVEESARMLPILFLMVTRLPGRQAEMCEFISSMTRAGLVKSGRKQRLNFYKPLSNLYMNCPWHSVLATNWP